MAMNREGKIGIGLLGLGVVGSRVASVLTERAERLAAQVGIPLTLCGILVKDLSKTRDGSLPSDLLTTDPEALLSNPDVDIIVELIGGEQPALDFLRAAIGNGKHVVTANKQVMAVHGPEIIRLAEDKMVNLLYEASVGGGIPIIGPLHKDLLANELTSLHAIINGTTNYILTRMSTEGLDFDSALRAAQALGYAESDPADDIEGTDAAYKLAILATLSFHTQVVASDIYREGISRVAARDFQYAGELGYTIKLLGIARRTGGGLSLRVHPVLIPQDHLLAKVDGAFNAIEIEGDLVGRVVFHGQGAGPRPTSSAVIGDILDVARGIASGMKPVRQRVLDNGLKLLPLEELVTQFYIRMTVADRPRVLAQITAILGDLDISIASVIQKSADVSNKTAEIVVMTHPSKEAQMHQAIQQLEALDAVAEVSNAIRVEQWA